VFPFYLKPEEEQTEQGAQNGVSVTASVVNNV
jgi:hypothetical protein